VREAATDPETVTIKSIDGRKVFEDQTRRVEIIDVGPTAHTNSLLVAFLPEEGLIFQADHFAMPQSGPVPPAVSSTRSFAAALQANDIAVERILSAHSPRVGTIDDLRASLEKEVVQVGQTR
jgi:glyoxylase-like metal-dependent hydrolase (beta-lactamase superfamily II)